MTSTIVETIRNRSPRSVSEPMTAVPGWASKTSRTGSALPPIDSGWISRRGRVRRDRLADLEHVRAQHEIVASGVEVVGVVLHEGHAAGQAVGHDLHRPDHGGRLPVAFGAEAVAVAHQALDGKAGQLGQPVEVLEGVGEGDEPTVVEESAQPELDPRAVAQRDARSPPGRSSGDHVVLVEIRLDERRRPRRRSRRR